MTFSIDPVGNMEVKAVKEEFDVLGGIIGSASVHTNNEVSREGTQKSSIECLIKHANV